MLNYRLRKSISIYAKAIFNYEGNIKIKQMTLCTEGTFSKEQSAETYNIITYIVSFNNENIYTNIVTDKVVEYYIDSEGKRRVRDAIELNDSEIKCISVVGILNVNLDTPTIDLGSFDTSEISNLEKIVFESKFIGNKFVKQDLSVVYNKEIKDITMPWCLSAVLGVIAARHKGYASLKAVDMAKVIRKTYWNLWNSIEYKEVEHTNNENNTYIVKEFTGGGEEADDVSRTCNKIINAFSLDRLGIEDSLFKEWFRQNFQDYIQYISQFNGMVYSIDTSVGYTEAKKLVEGLGYSSAIYNNDKGLRVRSIKGYIDNSKSQILWLQSLKGIKEDNKHAAVIEGYTENCLWVMDSNGSDEKHCLCLIDMVDELGRLIVPYGVSNYRVQALQVINTNLQRGIQESSLEDSSIVSGVPIQLSSDTLIRMSRGITGDLSQQEVSEISFNKSEYCALVIMLRFMEFNGNDIIGLSIPEVLRVVAPYIDTLENWNALAKLAFMRGHRQTELKSTQKEGDITKGIDNGLYSIWLCDRYNTDKDGNKTDKCGTYAMVCIGYTKDDFVTYHLVDGIITKKLIPRDLFKEFRVNNYLCVYEKAITGFLTQQAI